MTLDFNSMSLKSRPTLTSQPLIRVSKGRTNRTTPNIFDQWLFPFPIEISNDLDVLIILNTTYILDLTSSQIIQDIASQPSRRKRKREQG
jgi:hypothetical protein